MTQKLLIVAGLATILSAQTLPAEPSIGTDGQYHPVVEGVYSFDCTNIRTEIRYRQERLAPESVGSLEESLRVTLLALSVAGRSVSSSDLERGRAILRSFAWITRVDATCYAGRVTISVQGMPLDPFIASVNDDGDLPALRTKTIRLSQGGIDEAS
jgi:hypothetical protein